jgi:hypothetical protein
MRSRTPGGARARSTGTGWTRRAADLVRERRHPWPKLCSSATQSTPPTVYFCAPDYDVPSGGIRVMYRHVDLLNDAGIRAAILHRRAKFRCTWFENRTRVTSSDSVAIGPADLVVVSELAVASLSSLASGSRFVIFNQNPHLTWQRTSAQMVRAYASSPDLLAIVTVSSHSAEMLRFAAPEATVVRVHNSIDPRLFHPAAIAPQRKTICFMPRGSSEEADQIRGILGTRGILHKWEVSPLHGLPEREVAERLRQTTVFLSLAYHEGFGLPAAEAMACGAYVVGFHGFAGREYFRPEFTHPVEPGDILGLARAVAEVVERETSEPGWCAGRGREAASFIAETYSPDRERAEVVSTYRALLGGDRPATHDGRPVGCSPPSGRVSESRWPYADSPGARGPVP